MHAMDPDDEWILLMTMAVGLFMVLKIYGII